MHPDLHCPRCKMIIYPRHEIMFLGEIVFHRECLMEVKRRITQDNETIKLTWLDGKCTDIRFERRVA